LDNRFQNQGQGQYVPVQPQQTAPQQDMAVENERAHPNLDFISTDNREQEYNIALKHSRKVKFWKIAFPVMGSLVILGIAGALFVNSLSRPEIAIENLSLNDGKLVMENPQLNGVDRNQRPYNLSATKAIQDSAAPNTVELQEILAELPMDEKVTATIRAGNGIYDAEARTLKLTQTVNVVTSSGMVLNLEDADIDIGNSSMETDNPINATSPQADIASNALSVEDGGNKMIFEGRVRMTLRPAELRKASEENE